MSDTMIPQPDADLTPETDSAWTPETESMSTPDAEAVPAAGPVAGARPRKTRRIVGLTAAGHALGGIITAGFLTHGFGVLGEAPISAVGALSLTAKADMADRHANGWFKLTSEYYTEDEQCMGAGGYDDMTGWHRRHDL
jgi:hypothetical protein